MGSDISVSHQSEPIPKEHPSDRRGAKRRPRGAVKTRVTKRLPSDSEGVSSAVA